KQLAQFEGHTDRVWHLLLAANGKTLASASEDGTVRLWDTATGKEQRQFRVGERGTVSLALSSDGRLVASGDRLGSLHIWDARTGAKLQHIAAPAMRHLGATAFSPDSKLLACDIFNKPEHPIDLTLFDVAGGKEVRRWSIPWDSGHMLFAPDGRSIAVTSD